VRAASIASRRATGDGRRRRDRRRSVRASRPRSVPRAGRDSASDLFPVARAVPENDAREVRGEERTGGRRWRERRRARAPRWTR
jgi:hypothetical protein